MLISKTVIVKWSRRTKKHYIELGYEFTKVGDKFEINVRHLTNGSGERVYVSCDCIDCKHKVRNVAWKDYLRCVKENDKYYCFRCAKKLYGDEKQRKTRLNNSKSFEQWCIDNNRIDVLDRWDYELNKYKPNEVNCWTNKKYYFKCPRKIHKSEYNSLNNFTNGFNGIMDCNSCNSFAQWGIDNLGEDFIEKYWDYDKNKYNPWEIAKASGKSVFIKCKGNHKSYKVICRDFNHGGRCPRCAEEKVESYLQEKVRLYFGELGYEILHEYKCTLKCINPLTNYLLPYDNEIKVNNKYLIIEVHGIQHYDAKSIFHQLSAKKFNTTPKQQFEYSQEKDTYKEEFALSKEYEYLIIPYYTDNIKETWKQLINNKIDYIKSVN